MNMEKDHAGFKNVDYFLMEDSEILALAEIARLYDLSILCNVGFEGTFQHLPTFRNDHKFLVFANDIFFFKIIQKYRNLAVS